MAHHQQLIPNTNYQKYEVDNFKQKLRKFTFGLDEVIPWEDSNFVFSGGLLYDIITDRYSEELSDIDLFFYGDVGQKCRTVNKLLDNLNKNQYKYIIGYAGSVIYIFIQQIPRIIQLIMFNKNEPESIIDSFDLEHVKFYSNGWKNGIMGSKKAISCLAEKTTYGYSKSQNVKIRLLKYFERGVKIDNMFDDTEYNFVLDYNESNKYIKSKKQSILYSTTYNLMQVPSDLSKIDFNDFPREKIDIYDFFGCATNYIINTTDYDFKENINMFGEFAEYFHIEPNDILSGEMYLPFENNFNEDAEKDFELCDEMYESIIKKSIEFDYVLYVALKGKFNSEDNILFFKYVFRTPKYHSFYSECKYLYDVENDDGLEIYFAIDNQFVIDYLLKIFKIIKMIGRSEYSIIRTENFIAHGHTKINKIFDEIKSSNVFFPITDKKFILEQMDNNLNNHDNSIIRNISDNSMIICSKIYDKSKLFETSGFGILHSLNCGDSINCLFDLNFNLNIDNFGREKNNFKIELVPTYMKKMSNSRI